MAYRIRYGMFRRRNGGLVWKLQTAGALGLLVGALVFPQLGDALRAGQEGAVQVMAGVLAQGGSLHEAVVAGCREVLFEGQD